jgi:hypothetical protein
MVRGAGFTVHEMGRLPLGVASTLRRAKSKAPALHRRAESPAISSTGQRPVDTGISQQPALKGRNPRSFDSAPSRRDGMCITVCKRSAAYGCGVHLHSKSRRDGTLLTVCFSLRTFSLRKILLLALAFFSCANLPAQVTIGGLENPKAGVNYSWYKNTFPSTSGGTQVKTGSICNTPTCLAEGIHYYYCMATSDACPSLYATLIGNSGVGYGTPATRAPFAADFAQSTTSTQEYIFSPSGTVSRLRFYVEENQTYSEQIIESLDYNRALKTQDDILGEQKFSIVYKNNLNETAKGTDNYNALMLGIYAVYNDAPDGSGTDKAVKLTALIKDCQCCGAYLNTARTRWLNFSYHNGAVLPVALPPTA